MEGAVQVVDADAGLVRRTRAGDRAAFADLIRAHQPAVLAYGLAALADEGQAKDLAQEVFLTFWRDREAYEHRGKLRAYLLTIARHRALAAHKKRRGQRRLAEALTSVPSPSPAGPLEDVERGARRRRLEAAIARLPEDRAEALRLRFGLGLSVAEVAEVLSVAPGTVKSRVARAVGALREELGDED